MNPDLLDTARTEHKQALAQSRVAQQTRPAKTPKPRLSTRLHALTVATPVEPRVTKQKRPARKPRRTIPSLVHAALWITPSQSDHEATRSVATQRENDYSAGRMASLQDNTSSRTLRPTGKESIGDRIGNVIGAAFGITLLLVFIIWITSGSNGPTCYGGEVEGDQRGGVHVTDCDYSPPEDPYP